MSNKKKEITIPSNLNHEGVKKASKKQSKDIQKAIKKQTLSRIRMNLTRWTTARTYAESEINPNNTELIRVFRDIEIDSHLWALMQTIRLKVMANSFNIYQANDEIDEEATKMFKKRWFRNTAKHIVDSDFYGFSLVQLGDIVNGCFKDATLVPREYVLQQKEGVKKSLGDTKDLIPYTEGVYKNWLVPAGERFNLGLLDKAAPLVIKKKEVIAAWSTAAELFGMPIRIGKTSISDDERRENMEEMLDDMGESAWAVINEDDEIELKEAAKTDFSNMYDKFIERVNSELSKLFLSQTGTTDEKTHVGSANVMENILKDVIESYVLKVCDVTNEVIIPLAQRHGLVKLGSYIKADNEQKLSVKELFDIVKELLPTMNIPKDWISETFDIPIEVEEELNKNEKAQSELRGSVGGVQALVDSIIAAVAVGTLEIDAAVAIIVNIYGFDEATAKSMIGNPKPPKVEEPKPTTEPKPKAKKESVMQETANLYKGVLKNCC